MLGEPDSRSSQNKPARPNYCLNNTRFVFQDERRMQSIRKKALCRSVA